MAVALVVPTPPLSATAFKVAEIRLNRRRLCTVRLWGGFLVVRYIRPGGGDRAELISFVRIMSPTLIIFSSTASDNLLNRFFILTLSKELF